MAEIIGINSTYQEEHERDPDDGFYLLELKNSRLGDLTFGQLQVFPKSYSLRWESDIKLTEIPKVAFEELSGVLSGGKTKLSLTDPSVRNTTKVELSFVDVEFGESSGSDLDLRNPRHFEHYQQSFKPPTRLYGIDYKVDYRGSEPALDYNLAVERSDFLPFRDGEKVGVYLDLPRTAPLTPDLMGWMVSRHILAPVLGARLDIEGSADALNQVCYSSHEGLIRRAIENSKNSWRTLPSIASELGLDESTISKILRDFDLVYSENFSPEGHKLFTTEDHFKRKASFWMKLRKAWQERQYK